MAKVKICETVLRDAHQSLVATRMTMDQMAPILEQMDKVGYYSLEAWGSATFDACIRFLGEDPCKRCTCCFTIQHTTHNIRLIFLLTRCRQFILTRRAACHFDQYRVHIYFQTCWQTIDRNPNRSAV